MSESQSYSFYYLESGMFTGAVLRSMRPRQLIRVPAGQGMREGAFDHLSQRVDLDANEVVDYQPEAPDDDHEWLHDDGQGNRVRRWVLKPEAVGRLARKAAARARIAELGRKTERATREHLLGIVPTEEDRAAGAMTLQEIENELATLRSEV